MPHCVTVVVLSLALAATLAEAKAQHIHVTAQVVQQTFTGEFANPQLGDQLITSVVLLNEEAEEVGTGTGAARSSASHLWRPAFSACLPPPLLVGRSFLAGSRRCRRPAP